MADIPLEEARLILSRWAETDALLVVMSSGQPGDLLGRFSVVEVTEHGAAFHSQDGVTQLRIGFSSYEITCGYFEPREFAAREDCKAWFASLSEAEKSASALLFTFSVRVEGVPPVDHWMVDLGKIVLTEKKS